MSDLRPLLSRPREIALPELAGDLNAVWENSSNKSDRKNVSSWITRPTILRRIASLLSESIADDTDRLVALGGGAEALGTALSLETGLPYCTVHNDTIFGEIYSGERIMLISVTPQTIPALVNASGARILSALVVLDETNVGCKALFQLTSSGALQPTDGES